MLIYKIPNKLTLIPHYICDSQATIDAIPVDKETGKPTIDPSLCSIGGQPDADALLLQNQNEWLTAQVSLFVVNLQTAVEGGIIWTVVDLNTEPQNTDREYFVFDTTDGLYEPAVGLDAAKALLAQIKQEYLVFTNMDKYKTFTSWTQ